jgi:DNA-binding response OmpR family regulator
VTFGHHGRATARRYGEIVTSLLIVEDDDRIREALRRALTGRGHEVRIVGTGLAGLQAAVDDPPDVVVLDLGLPDIEGRQLLSMLRAVSQVPVIVATARDDEAEMVATLDAGADDYVVKPYSAAQLEARMRAVLRRSRAEVEQPMIVVGPLAVDPSSHTATLHGTELDLTRREFDLLAYLAARAGRVVSKRRLMADVWGQPYGGADKTVDVHVSWLRRKLGESAADPQFITTIRGVGVKLSDPTS